LIGSDEAERRHQLQSHHRSAANKRRSRTPVTGPHHGLAEAGTNLPILVQNALIALAGGPGRTAMMMRNQITKCRNSRAQLLSGTMAPVLDADLSFSWLDVDLASISGTAFSLWRCSACYDVSILPGRLQEAGVVRRHNDSHRSHHLERDEQGA
jgi:hypothetical protein